MNKTTNRRIRQRGSVTKISHAAAEVALQNIGTIASWIIRCTLSVRCASLQEEQACVSDSCLLAECQTLIVHIRTVVGLLLVFTVRPGDITGANVTFYSYIFVKKKKNNHLIIITYREGKLRYLVADTLSISKGRNGKKYKL